MTARIKSSRIKPLQRRADTQILRRPATSPLRRRHPHVSRKTALKSRRRVVTHRLGHRSDAVATFAQASRRQQHAPAREVLHRRFAEHVLEAFGQARARCRRGLRERIHRPAALRRFVQQCQRAAHERIAQPGEPAGFGFGQGFHMPPQGFDEHQLGHPQTQTRCTRTRRQGFLFGVCQQRIQRGRVVGLPQPDLEHTRQRGEQRRERIALATEIAAQGASGDGIAAPVQAAHFRQRRAAEQFRRRHRSGLQRIADEISIAMRHHQHFAGLHA